MSKSVIFMAILFLSVFQGFAQEEGRLKKLTALQTQLNQVQAKSDEPVDSLKTSISDLKAERDSLQLLVELLNAELLLTKSKLTKEKQLTSAHKIDKDVAALHGYFVVIESERSETEARQQANYLEKWFPEQQLVILRNERKTWYHVCISQPHDRGAIGMAVKKARTTGIKDAWWIGL